MIEHQDHNGVLTVEEVAQYLKIPRSSVYTLYRSGQLKAVKVGKYWRCRREVIEQYLLQLESFIEPFEIITVLNDGSVHRRKNPKAKQ